MEGHTHNFKNIVDSIKDNSDVDCSKVDVQHLEQAGMEAINNLQDYIQNIEITSAQFDVDVLVEEASKLGMDFGDLSEYGFDLKNSKCGNKPCFSK